MALGTVYAPQGPKSTSASLLSEYTTDDVTALSYPGNVAAAVVSSQLAKTSDATLAAIPGLAVILPVGTYAIEAYLPSTSGASGGVKVSLDTSDTLATSAASLTAELNAAAAMAIAQTTSMATGVGTTAAVIETYISGTVVVSTAGTLIIKGAQNASNASATTFLVNGWLKVTRIA